METKDAIESGLIESLLQPLDLPVVLTKISKDGRIVTPRQRYAKAIVTAVLNSLEHEHDWLVD